MYRMRSGSRFRSTHNTKKRWMKVFSVFGGIVCVFAIYVAIAIQMPEEKAFERVEQVSQQKWNESLQNGGDPPQPSSGLFGEGEAKSINPILMSFERVLPVWQSASEDFYAIAGKSDHQMRLSAYAGMMDILSADLREIPVRFAHLTEKNNEWVSGDAMVRLQHDGAQYSFESHVGNDSAIVGKVISSKSDHIRWDIQQNGELQRKIEIAAIAPDTFFVQETFYEGPYKGTAAVRFSNDGKMSYMRTSDLIDTFELSRLLETGWDAYTQEMENQFSMTNNRITIGDMFFE